MKEMVSETSGYINLVNIYSICTSIQ